MDGGPAITGFHAIDEALKTAQGAGTLWLCGRRRRNLELEARARAAGVSVIWATLDEVERHAPGRDHRGAVYLGARAVEAPRALGAELRALGEGSRLVLVLDHLKDPHNLGAILRSADQFGADLVLVPERRSVGLTPAVARVSAGAAAHVPTRVVGNLAVTLRLLREAGFWVYGAHLEGERPDRVRFADRCALVLGAEGAGLAPLTVKSCDLLVRIPSSPGSHVDSLNVSVAAGILMYEIRRVQGYFDAPDR